VRFLVLLWKCLGPLKEREAGPACSGHDGVVAFKKEGWLDLTVG